MPLKTLINKLKPEQPKDIKKVTDEFIIPEDFIIKKLAAADRVPVKDRTATYDGYVHVSSIVDLCARKYAIVSKEEMQPTKSVSGGMKVVWAMGRAIEKHVRDSLMSTHHKNNFVGIWSCLCGEQTFSGVGHIRNCTCPLKKPMDNYNEYTLFDHELKVVGNPDLITQYKNVGLITEVKSMNKKQFDALEEPIITHILQAMWYPYLAHKIGLPVYPIISIVYVTKDFIFGSPYKEFHIDTREERYVKAFESMLEELTELRKFEETGVLPKRTMCQSDRSAMAKECPACFDCFMTYRNEPPEEKE